MKFYLLSPEGVPMNQVLFPTFIKTFESNGCSFVGRIEDCDVVLMDLHSRLFDYRQSDVDYILNNDIKLATFDEWDRGNMSKDKYPKPLTSQQISIMAKRMGNGVHFCRLLDKTERLPPNIYPYEKPISYEEPLLTEDELFNRGYDVVFIANESPSRDAIAKALRSGGRLNCFISIGAEKLPFVEFLRIHKLGKLFVSSGAGGFTDERKQCLFSVSGLIQEDHNQLLAHPFTNLVNCIKISNPPTKEELDTIVEVVNNKEKLYEIYKNNYTFMKRFYSEEYLSQYILDKIIKHLQ
jgi:hypothetical protein